VVSASSCAISSRLSGHRKLHQKVIHNVSRSEWEVGYKEAVGIHAINRGLAIYYRNKDIDSQYHPMSHGGRRWAKYSRIHYYLQIDLDDIDRTGWIYIVKTKKRIVRFWI
jgi:hypothetical protein